MHRAHLRAAFCSRSHLHPAATQVSAHPRTCSTPPYSLRYEAESLRGEVLFRGTFATQRQGGPLSNALDPYVKNTSNTNVVEWHGKLLSLFEAGQPYRLDPNTLETLVGGWSIHLIG